jgi:hypothetical protein
MSTPPQNSPREFSLLDRERPVKFTGVELAFASSDQDGKKPRWYEITIYKTVGGNYVAQRVGKSRVYHAVNSSCRVPTHDLIKAHELEDDEIPCPVCHPPEKIHLIGGEPLRAEIDRPTVEVWPEAGKLIRNLYVKDKELDAYRLPKVVRRALSKASSIDDGIREAYNTEYVA